MAVESFSPKLGCGYSQNLRSAEIFTNVLQLINNNDFEFDILESNVIMKYNNELILMIVESRIPGAIGALHHYREYIRTERKAINANHNADCPQTERLFKITTRLTLVAYAGCNLVDYLCYNGAASRYHCYQEDSCVLT